MPRKILSILFSMILALSVLPVHAAAEEAEPGSEEEAVTLNSSVYNNLYYEIINGYVTITGHKADFLTLEIPAEIDGYPVTAIGENAFQNCHYLREVTLPDSIQIINNYAFNGCTALEKAVLGSGIIDIGAYAFNNCISLSDLSYGNRLETIGDYAFSGCSGLDGTLRLSHSLETIGEAAFMGCSGLTGDIVIPNTVKEISADAFSGCSGFDGELILYSGTTVIGDFAFYKCSSLQGPLNLPSGITRIGDGAFHSCYKLSGDLVLPEKLTYLGENSFAYCTDIADTIVIPDGLEKISPGAFAWCSGFTALNMGIGVKEVGEAAFNRCGSLTTVYYAGSDDEWNSIVIGDKNDPLLEAERIFTGNVPAEGVELNESSLELAKGSSVQLTASVYPENASNKNVSWSSSDDSIASVDTEGKVTAVSDGTALITVTTEDGGFTASCSVTVKTPVKPETLHFYSEEAKGLAGDRMDLYFERTPSESLLYPLNYYSSDPDVAEIVEVGSNYVTVELLKEGTTEIEIYCESVYDRVLLTVLEGDYAGYITFPNGNGAVILKDDTYQLQYRLGINSDPSKTEFADEKVTFTVNDPSIASVDENGLVTGLKAGTTGITASITIGSEAYFTLTVSERPESVAFREDVSYRIPDYADNKNIQDFVTMTPQGTVVGAFELTSSDPSVITITPDGWMSFENAGTATITLKAKNDASIKASHSFEVYDAPAPTSMSAPDLPETVYTNYKYHLHVDYEAADADPSTDWVLDAGDSAGQFRLYRYSEEFDNQAVLCVFGTGDITVTATSRANPSLTHTFTFHAAEGNEAYDAYDSSFRLYDVHKDAMIENAEEYVLELGRTYTLIMDLTGSRTVPCNDRMNNYYFNTLFSQEFFDQITLAEPGQSSGQGAGANLLIPDLVQDGCGVLIKTTQKGSQEFTFLGKTVKITVVDKTHEIEIEPQENEVYNEGNVDESIIDALRGGGDLGAGEALANAAGENWILDLADIPEDADSLLIRTYFEIHAEGYTKDEETGDAELSLSITPSFALIALDENGQEMVPILMIGNLTIDEPVTLRIPVGDAFDGFDTVYIRHITYDFEKVYKGTVEDGYVVFENPDGFSQFIITTKPIDDHHVNGVELNKNELTLRVGKSEKLTATVLPADAEDKSVTWSSSDPTAVTVDQNGRVTAVADHGIEQPSQAVITVTTKDGGYTASCTVTVEDPINQFVRRLYRLCFDREAEESGFNTWTTVLKNRSYTAARAVVGFFLSDEMKALDLEPEEFVERCYLVMMDRESDEGGMKTWSDCLDAGMSELFILSGFIGSGEFQAICADTGIEVGTIKITEARDMNFGITAFVSRCYTEVLERTAEAEGLNTWCGYIFKDANRKANAIWVASNGFFHSPEYLAKHTSDAEYVHTLYRTFFGRDEDEGGYKTWMGELAKGKSRDYVMSGFSNSKEFNEIMASYGIR
ncbi:MAG: leucine-rich repeat protein [Solobacterium sp.]|nr:leucine-rich repeat protein [Solobacterium sp.]